MNKNQSSPSDPDISDFLAGLKLYGDDLTLDEINNWFSAEQEGYANLGSKDRSQYRYDYHELNKYHSFKFIQKKNINQALGLGSAYGDEFEPITGRLKHITILDPSDAFSSVVDINGTPCTYVKPNASGDMPFETGRFDLITCFGVMHHIPNVSHVIKECYRCLSNDGLFLIREPIVSMGDWRKPRDGLTKNERGIPLAIFEKIVRDAGFTIRSKSLCDFRPIPAIAAKFGVSAFNSSSLVVADAILSKLFGWNCRYHRTRSFEKFAPASVAFVLQK